MSDDSNAKNRRGRKNPFILELTNGKKYGTYAEMAKDNKIPVREHQSARDAVNGYLAKHPESPVAGYKVYPLPVELNQNLAINGEENQNSDKLGDSHDKPTESIDNIPSPQLAKMQDIMAEKVIIGQEELDRIMVVISYAAKEGDDVWLKVDAKTILPQLLQLQYVGLKIRELKDIRLEGDVE